MNIRVIDPPQSARTPQDPPEDVCGDSDDDEPAGDERLDLLLDLKSLMLAYLRRAAGNAGLAIRADAVERDIATLRRAGQQAAIRLSPAPRVDLGAGFAALARQAAVDGFDPFANEDDLLTGTLLLNSLGLAMIQGFLRESDARPWRPVLLPMLADDARFDGWLNGVLAGSGDQVIERAAGLRALASGPAAGSERLWSFGLLRMAISHLLCGGPQGHRGGFFPDGMSATAGEGVPPP